MAASDEEVERAESVSPSQVAQCCLAGITPPFQHQAREGRVVGAPACWRLTLGAADGPSAPRECEGLRWPAADQDVRPLSHL